MFDTLRELVEQRTQSHGDRPFVSFRGTTLSFGQFDAAADRAANALRDQGVRPGDLVCLMLENSLDFMSVWFGLSKLGAVIVPINTRLVGEGFRYIVEHSETRHLVIEAALLDRYMEIRRQLRRLPALIVRGATERGPSLEALLASAPTTPPGTRWNDLCSVIYTSGTTGMPKGVMIGQRSYLNTGHEMVERICGIQPDDVLYTCLPLFHVNAQQLSVMGALMAGVPLVLDDHFSASRFWPTIRSARATIFNSLGAMMTILFKQPARPDDADNPVRLVLGAATPAQIWRPFEQRFDLRITEGYGLTEVGCCCSSNPLGAIKPGSIGIPNRWAEMRIASSTDEELPPNELGEILIRSKVEHAIMEGYFKEPTKTAEAMRGGWFHSGDRGYRDEQGYLYFVDRLKDLIRRRGENISSFEVENAVNSYPAVLQSAAVGVPSELSEDEVLVAVVPRPGEIVDPADLIRHCEKRLASFMVPRYVRVMDRLPMTATERVQKFELRALGPAGAWDRNAAE